MREAAAPPRVVHVIDSLGTGGAETLVVDLAILARNHGWQADIVTLWEAEGLPLERARQAGLSPSSVGGSRIPTPAACLRLWRLCHRASLVHVHLFPASHVVAILPGAHPRIYTEHASTNLRRGSRLLRFIDTLVFRRYRRIVCVSRDSAAAMTQALGTQAGGHVMTINNGVRPEFFGVCKSGWPQGSRIRILSVGRLIPSKNFDLVLHLVANNENTQVTLLGDGPEHDRLVQLAADLGITDRFRLLPPSDRLSDVMAVHDVFIHPSLSEGFGLVVLEAMASRLPILVADIPGVRSFAENGRTAVMFEPGDSASLQSGFEAVVGDAHSRQQRVQAAQEKARHFTIEAASAEYCALYDEILADEVRQLTS